MKRIISILLIFLCTGMHAQTAMRIHCKNGTKVDVAVEEVDSVTFIEQGEGTGSEQAVELTGSWLWGDKDAGYYELLTFNSDKTYTGYDNYFTYGYDTMTYGFYGQVGTILSLWSNGFGYQHRYTWFITGLTDSALSVMTKMGPFTYYRLQPEVIHLKINDSISCMEDDSWLFTDGVTASINGKSLTALAKGETYVQKLLGATNSIVAFKVIVE